jgi:hypothetical protein
VFDGFDRHEKTAGARHARRLSRSISGGGLRPCADDLLPIPFPDRSRENGAGYSLSGDNPMAIRMAFARLSFLLALASAPLLAAAGNPKATMVAPSFDGPTQIGFSTDQVSKWTDLPLGTYRVPNSDVIISGHQKGGAAPMLLFGLIGMAVQSGINAGNGKEAMASAERALTFSIDEEAKAKLVAALADPAYAGKFTVDTTADRRFDVTGAVVMSFANELEALPYVTLRVKLMGKGGKSKLWTTRYIASSGARRPILGAGSWTENGGEALRPQVSTLLDLAIQTMLKDIATPYPREEASLTNVHGFFVHVNKPLQVVGYKLSEEDGRMLFLPKLGTSIVFAGVNVLDTASVWQQPAGKKDRPLKLLKPDDPTLAGIAPKAVAPVAGAAQNAVLEAFALPESAEAEVLEAEAPEGATAEEATPEEATPQEATPLERTPNAA